MDYATGALLRLQSTTLPQLVLSGRAIRGYSPTHSLPRDLEYLLHLQSNGLGYNPSGLSHPSSLGMKVSRTWETCLCIRQGVRLAWSLLASLVVLAPSAHALLRFPCSQLVTQRFDPLVTPGIVSPHVHQIVGGNAFDIYMDPSIDYAKKATCTTCKFKEDASNYWTAVLYFKNPNGSYIRVPQMANQFTGSPNGGMTVYYIQPSNNQRVTSFPKGFRMIVGNPMIRNNTHRDANSAAARAITWRCFGANFGSDPSYPHPGTGPLDTIELPKKACAGGIRSNVFFPSCWNGKDLDPADHAVRPVHRMSSYSV
ncbi:hypothetical protein NMY22_g15911 [Coprinellus aureogranulatus]|nr:hypothetical protein NMY22_g15911 [Coprinellus aureogranulatus]